VLPPGQLLGFPPRAAPGSQPALSIGCGGWPLCREPVVCSVGWVAEGSGQAGWARGCRARQEGAAQGDKWVSPCLFGVTQGRTFMLLLAPKPGMHPAKALSAYSNRSWFGL